MKLIKWMCECGEPLPDYTGYEYVICEKCGAKYRIEKEVGDTFGPPYHVTVVAPMMFPEPYTWRLGGPYTWEPEEPWRYKITCLSTSSLGGLRTTHGG